MRYASFAKAPELDRFHDQDFVGITLIEVWNKSESSQVLNTLGNNLRTVTVPLLPKVSGHLPEDHVQTTSYTIQSRDKGLGVDEGLDFLGRCLGSFFLRNLAGA